MKAKELINMDTSALEKKCKTLQEELFKLRFQLSLGQLASTAKVKEVRRDIARIKTILTQRNTAE